MQHLQFVWRGPDADHSELLVVLGQDGIVRIIHLELAEVLATVGPPTEAFIDQFLLCNNGRCASTPGTCPMPKKSSKSNASPTMSSRQNHHRSPLFLFSYLTCIMSNGEMVLFDMPSILDAAHSNAKPLNDGAAFTDAAVPTQQRLRRHAQNLASSKGSPGRGRARSAFRSGKVAPSAPSVHSAATYTVNKQARGGAATGASHSKAHQQRRAPPSVASATSAATSTSRHGAYMPTEASLRKAREPLVLAERPPPPSLQPHRLREVLRGYGEYPARYRAYIWRHILQLPQNHGCFNQLLAMGTHGAFLRLHRTYPMRSRRLLRVLQRTLSCLAHWSPVFGEAPFLPATTFPFVKYLCNSPLEAFEVLATVLLNWGQLWFEFFPNPPISVLNMTENVLAHYDVDLLRHFIREQVTSQVYAWPLIHTLLSEVLPEPEWLAAWDNIFSNHPGFYIFVVVAFLRQSRAALLACREVENFDHFFHQHQPVDVAAMLEMAYAMAASVPEDIDPSLLLEVCPRCVPRQSGTDAALTRQQLSSPCAYLIFTLPRPAGFHAADKSAVSRLQRLSSLHCRLPGLTTAGAGWWSPLLVLRPLLVNPLSAYTQLRIPLHQVKERERIRQQELEFLREKAAVLASQREAMFLAKEEATWAVKQDALLNAEEQRRAWYVHSNLQSNLETNHGPYLLAFLSNTRLSPLSSSAALPFRRLRREKEKLAAQRAKLLELKRDQRMREVKVFDESRKSFLERQQRIHEAELQRLEEEARATRMQRRLMKEDLANEAQDGRLYVGQRSCEPLSKRADDRASAILHCVLAWLSRLHLRVNPDLRKVLIVYPHFLCSKLSGKADAPRTSSVALKRIHSASVVFVRRQRPD